MYICAMRKNIDLPKNTISILNKLAKKERMKFKPYAERILINVANSVVIENKTTA